MECTYRMSGEDAIVFTEWETWSDCSVTCGDGVKTRTRSCQAGCSTSAAMSLAVLESEACDMGGPCGSPCIEYRSNQQCTGDIIFQTSTTGPTETTTNEYQSPEGYGRCASMCIGIEGSIAFNWRNRGTADADCECLRKVLK